MALGIRIRLEHILIMRRRFSTWKIFSLLVFFLWEWSAARASCLTPSAMIQTLKRSTVLCKLALCRMRWRTCNPAVYSYLYLEYGLQDCRRESRNIERECSMNIWALSAFCGKIQSRYNQCTRYKVYKLRFWRGDVPKSRNLRDSEEITLANFLFEYLILQLNFEYLKTVKWPWISFWDIKLSNLEFFLGYQDQKVQTWERWLHLVLKDASLTNRLE